MISFASYLAFALCSIAVPPFTLWRYRDLKERGFVKSRAQLKKMIDEYGFPEGKLLSPNTRTWTDLEVISYYETRPSERKPGPLSQPPALDGPKPWDGPPEIDWPDTGRKPAASVKGRRAPPPKNKRTGAEA